MLFGNKFQINISSRLKPGRRLVKYVPHRIPYSTGRKRFCYNIR